jgi:hypothetical protein
MRVLVEAAGLDAWPAPLTVSESERGAIIAAAMELPPDQANELVVRDLYVRIDARAGLAGIHDAVTAFRPDLVLHESAEFAGALEAERVGLPSVAVDISLASFAVRFEQAVLTGLRELRAEIGLPGCADLSEPRFSLLPAALEDERLDLPPVRRFRERPAARRSLPGWWDGDERPLVYLTFGSVVPGTPFFPDGYRAAIESLASLEVRVLVTIGGADPSALGELPRSVHVEPWVAQDDVLPHAAAVVCHGGAGTVAGALAAGAPLAVLPLFADQPFNAGRVAESGAGIAIEGGPSTRRPCSRGSEPGAAGRGTRRRRDRGAAALSGRPRAA